MLGGLAVILLTLVGYTSGAALLAPRRQPVPFLTDILILAALWTAGFLLRPVLASHWQSVAQSFALAFAVSAVITLFRRGSLPPARTVPDEGGKPTFLRRIKAAWTGFARRMGNYQGRLILAFFYFTVVLPFGVPVRLFSDPLALRKPPVWHPRNQQKPDINRSRLQF
jgi:hypothetical protein